MKRFYFGTNFKMNPTARESLQFLEALQRSEVPENVQLFLIPPFTSLPGLPALADPSGLWIGAQNMHYADSGAYTGEISARMLADLGVHLVMLGHAERRQHFGETDAALQQKVRAALNAGLRVLLCVGEDARERGWGVETETLARQLKIALLGVDPVFCPRLMIAYEPVWSIGEGGRPATVGDILPPVRCIRETLRAIFDIAADAIPVLYGGSVNADNCASYAALDQIDGLFVGRAAWQVPGFIEVMTRSLAAKRARV
jgi:triosephosphate isomerase